MSEIPGMVLTSAQNEHLDWLEAKSIYIIREVVAEYRNPALLFSGDKDSIVMLHLALKAFRLGECKIELPFSLAHIDAGHNYPEMITFRDEQVAELGARLVVGHVEDSIKYGTVRLRKETNSRSATQAVTLLETIESHSFDALMGGARRDEEKARAKERTFPFRDEFGQWDPEVQHPGLWSLYNARMAQDEQVRVFPISNWAELDVWQYIARENLALPPIYYARECEVTRKNDPPVPVTSITPKADGDASEVLSVCLRIVSDISCTCPVASTAATPAEIITETVVIEITERGVTRMGDQTSEAPMEKRKKEGYL